MVASEDNQPDNAAPQEFPPEFRRVRNRRNGNEQVKIPDISKPTLWGLITGGIGAVIGYAAGITYATYKLIPFNKEINGLTRNDIMNRRAGIGAAIDSSGGASMGSLAAGLGEHTLKESHYYNAISKTEYKFVKFLEVIGGKNGFALATAATAGLTAAAAGYLLAPKKAEKNQSLPNPQDWQSRVVSNEQESAQRAPGA